MLRITCIITTLLFVVLFADTCAASDSLIYRFNPQRKQFIDSICQKHNHEAIYDQTFIVLIPQHMCNTSTFARIKKFISETSDVNVVVLISGMEISPPPPSIHPRAPIVRVDRQTLLRTSLIDQPGLALSVLLMDDAGRIIGCWNDPESVTDSYTFTDSGKEREMIEPSCRLQLQDHRRYPSLKASGGWYQSAITSTGILYVYNDDLTVLSFDQSGVMSHKDLLLALGRLRLPDSTLPSGQYISVPEEGTSPKIVSLIPSDDDSCRLLLTLYEGIEYDTIEYERYDDGYLITTQVNARLFHAVGTVYKGNIQTSRLHIPTLYFSPVYPSTNGTYYTHISYPRYYYKQNEAYDRKSIAALPAIAAISNAPPRSIVSLGTIESISRAPFPNSHRYTTLSCSPDGRIVCLNPDDAVFFFADTLTHKLQLIPPQGSLRQVFGNRWAFSRSSQRDFDNGLEIAGMTTTDQGVFILLKERYMSTSPVVLLQHYSLSGKLLSEKRVAIHTLWPNLTRLVGTYNGDIVLMSSPLQWELLYLSVRE